MARLLDELAPDAETRTPMGQAAGYDPETRRFMPGSAIAAGTVEDTVRLWAAFRPDLELGYMIERSEAIAAETVARSEEHTSELQSRGHLVCRLLLEKKK